MLWITVVNSTCFILIITKHTLLWYEFNICYWCHTLQKRKIVQIHCQTHNASQRKNRTQWMLPRWNRSPRQPVPQQHLQHRRYRHDRSITEQNNSDDNTPSWRRPGSFRSARTNSDNKNLNLRKSPCDNIYSQTIFHDSSISYAGGS